VEALGGLAGVVLLQGLGGLFGQLEDAPALAGLGVALGPHRPVDGDGARVEIDLGPGEWALGLTLPVTLAIAGLLVVLAVSYCQVITVHLGGGGAYAVGKKDLGPRSVCWRPRAWWWTTC